jgi:hypothetical protein
VGPQAAAVLVKQAVQAYGDLATLYAFILAQLFEISLFTKQSSLQSPGNKP